MDSIIGFWLVFKLRWHLEFDHSPSDDLMYPCRRCAKSIPELNAHWQNIQKKIDTKNINVTVKLNENVYDQISGQQIRAGSEIKGLYIDREYCAVIYNNDICILPRSAWNTAIRFCGSITLPKVGHYAYITNNNNGEQIIIYEKN